MKAATALFQLQLPALPSFASDPIQKRSGGLEPHRVVFVPGVRAVIFDAAPGRMDGAVDRGGACERIEQRSTPAFAPQTAEGPLSAIQREHARELAQLPPDVPPNGVDPPIDHAGRTQQDKASYYGPEFQGRTMANGRKFNPHDDAAASTTLRKN